MESQLEINKLMVGIDENIKNAFYEIWSIAFEEGRKVGYFDGYEEGYDDGYKDLEFSE